MVFLKSATKLVIISCLVLFHGLAVAAESNKEKLKQMLDGANKPQTTAAIPDGFLTGHWVGIYDYNNRNADTPPANTFSMVIEHTPDEIAAIILEPDLGAQYYAQIADVVNPRMNGKTFSFTKKYTSGSTIDYILEIDVKERAMFGRWSVNNGPSGIVQIGKIEAKDFQ